MQIELVEPVAEQLLERLSTDTSSASILRTDPDLQLGASVNRVNRVQLARADEPTVLPDAEDPDVLALLDLLEPRIVLGLRDRVERCAELDELSVVDPRKEQRRVLGPQRCHLDRRHRLSSSSP